MEHPGGELSDQVRSDPQGETGYGHGQPAHFGGVHLREEHEDYGADGDGAAEYVGQEEGQQQQAGDSQGFAIEEVEADQEQADDHAGNAVVNKVFTTYFVDDDDGQDGGKGID